MGMQHGERKQEIIQSFDMGNTEEHIKDMASGISVEPSDFFVGELIKREFICK
jgi:hypothetical protein